MPKRTRRKGARRTRRTRKGGAFTTAMGNFASAARHAGDTAGRTGQCAFILQNLSAEEFRTLKVAMLQLAGVKNGGFADPRFARVLGTWPEQCIVPPQVTKCDRSGIGAHEAAVQQSKSWGSWSTASKRPVAPAATVPARAAPANPMGNIFAGWGAKPTAAPQATKATEVTPLVQQGAV